MVTPVTGYVSQNDVLRAGVIPYVYVNGSLHFLFGRDTVSGDLTDFGGGVKKGESILDAAIREFKEETNKSFGSHIYSHNNFYNCVVLQDAQMTIFFLRLDPKWLDEANKKFYSQKKKYKYMEVNKFVWIHENRLKRMLYYNNSTDNVIIWSKVKNFINSILSIDTQRSFYYNLTQRPIAVAAP